MSFRSTFSLIVASMQRPRARLHIVACEYAISSQFPSNSSWFQNLWLRFGAWYYESCQERGIYKTLIIRFTSSFSVLSFFSLRFYPPIQVRLGLARGASRRRVCHVMVLIFPLSIGQDSTIVISFTLRCRSSSFSCRTKRKSQSSGMRCSSISLSTHLTWIWTTVCMASGATPCQLRRKLIFVTRFVWDDSSTCSWSYQSALGSHRGQPWFIPSHRLQAIARRGTQPSRSDNWGRSRWSGLCV